MYFHWGRTMGNADKIFRYWAVVAAGFEEVALDEMAQTLPGLRVDRQEKGRSQVKIFFTYERSPLRLLDLRSVQALYALILDVRGITVGKPGMLSLVNQIAGSDLRAAQRLASVFDSDRSVDVCHVNATVQGHHRFGVSDLVYRVHKALEGEYGLAIGAPGQGLLLQLQVRGRRAVLGMRLRTSQETQHHATSFCIGRILGLEPGDRILWLRRDTTEVAELIQTFGVEVYSGTEDVKITVRRIPGNWFLWDGESVPVLDGKCSHLLATCRVGKELAIVGELARLLPVGCVGLVEVGRKEVMLALLADHEALEIAAVFPLEHRGRQHYLYVIERVLTEDFLQV